MTPFEYEVLRLLRIIAKCLLGKLTAQSVCHDTELRDFWIEQEKLNDKRIANEKTE